ncbi:Zn-ribbon domain-containing OB-fold protein [Candidatus Woesearchaeota archaeon]|nr:Zn-ribbon domain-containing OB-fold protein [Candidatus Woesearchaeota archaeon]
MYRESPIIRWRRYPERYRLEGNKCAQCSKIYFPKTYLCECGSKKFLPHQLKPRGKILTYTEIKSSPEEFSEMTPYCVAIIELNEGPKITTQIADCDVSEIKIGDEVEMVFRKFLASGEEGIIHYGFKFKKVEENIVN